MIPLFYIGLGKIALGICLITYGVTRLTRGMPRKIWVLELSLARERIPLKDQDQIISIAYKALHPAGTQNRNRLFHLRGEALEQIQEILEK